MTPCYRMNEQQQQAVWGRGAGQGEPRVVFVVAMATLAAFFFFFSPNTTHLFLSFTAPLFHFLLSFHSKIIQQNPPS